MGSGLTTPLEINLTVPFFSITRACFPNHSEMQSQWGKKSQNKRDLTKVLIFMACAFADSKVVGPICNDNTNKDKPAANDKPAK